MNSFWSWRISDNWWKAIVLRRYLTCSSSAVSNSLPSFPSYNKKIWLLSIFAFYKPHLSGSRLSWLKQHIDQVQLSISNCLSINIKSKTGINIPSLVTCNDVRIFILFFKKCLMCIQSTFFLGWPNGMRVILGEKDWVVLFKICGESQS